ncbi:unnamed protein product [Cyprideis torosa]|uniref:DNA polymerase epsilon subunit 3 n=1 Tax=Cyprideis torosa TaxID=163714 RepID=A0A7R8WB28_9CRUS|nr:unnamed protein product [Cyprideis torosa]CAG0889058.1 unnamed protein product [Cyprideis torosa]
MAENPDDLSLPISVVSRLIREALPEGIIISKECRVAMTKACSVFILYCASNANSLAQSSKRKTLGAKDIIETVEELEFGDMRDELMRTLEAFKESQKQKKDTAARKKKEKTEATSGKENQENSPPKEGKSKSTPEKQKTSSSVAKDKTLSPSKKSPTKTSSPEKQADSAMDTDS